MKVAARLPVRIRYWVSILEIGHATRNSENVPATPLHEVLNNLRAPKNVT